MSSVKFCVLLAVLCSSQLGHGDVVTTPKPYTIDVPHPRPSLESVPISPSVHTDEAPAVVSEKAVPEEIKPKPTTPAPPTTTASTTAAPTTPAPTTPAPTTPAPSPTPKPGPTPPEQGSWSWLDKEKNITCIVIQFAAQLNITAPQGNNETLSHVIMNIPANAYPVDGLCNKTEQWLLLSWSSANVSAPNNTLRLVYSLNETTKNYELKGLNVTLNPDILVNSSSSDMLELWHDKCWQTPLATSYRCNPPTELQLTSDVTNVAGVLTLSHLQEEAFRTTPAAGFSAARECGGGDVPDAVPIAVGCALGGLVVVVLVAYLVARRRSAARGYLSM